MQGVSASGEAARSAGAEEKFVDCFACFICHCSVWFMQFEKFSRESFDTKYPQATLLDLLTD